MLYGLPPFFNKEQNIQKMFQAIREKEVTFGTKVKVSEEAKSFIRAVIIQLIKLIGSY